MNRHQQLQQTFRKAIEELLAAHTALTEKLSTANLDRYGDAVRACSLAQVDLSADGWSSAAKRLRGER